MATRDQYYQSSSSKGSEKPPQLPPRDGNAIYSQNLPTVIPEIIFRHEIVLHIFD